MIRTLTTGILLAVLGSSLGGCITIRNVTAETWMLDGSGFYLGYWEGTYGAFGYSLGKSKVMWCSLSDDNSVSCTDQPAVTAALEADG